MAGSPLVGAFLLDALLGISESNSSGNFIQAVVFDDAAPKVSGISVTLFGKACGIASGIVDTFLFTVLKSGETFGILLAGAKLVTAL